MSRTPPVVLAFAASDPTGGAGLQADVMTIAAMGCHPLSVVTALTAQDTSGVARVQALEGAWVADQARTVLADIRVDAFKLGVLGSAENARMIAGILAAHPEIPVVMDPVLASARGDALASADLPAALCAELAPLTTLMTPNSLEARALASAHALHDCAARLQAMGCDYVLITGTHEEEEAEVVNVLYGPGGNRQEDRWPRLPGSYHGSGCTLASSIAAALAQGAAVPEAVRRAQQFTWNALAGGFRPGGGQCIPQRSSGPRGAGET
jgi:hydroxymethylpyrimidine/phosphomethylpyrimidine kinase